jgi:hypothetical protein
VFSAEMPDEPSSAIPPLDADTAERLLCGRLDPDDAPPGYAEVASLLRAAAAPADQAEPTGEAAAMHAYRTTLPRGRPNAARTRGRLVALALAGVVAVGGVGVWTAGGVPFSRELRSSGGPSAGGAGSGTLGSGANGAGLNKAGRNTAGPAGSLRPSRPGLDSAPGTAPVAGDRRSALPTPSERATARHGGGVTARGGGSAQGVRPTRPHGQTRPKSKPPKPRSPKPTAPKAHASKAETPKAKTPKG